MSVSDKCATEEDLMSIMLEEVRSMRASFDGRLARIEGVLSSTVAREIEQLKYDLNETNTNIRFLVNAYKNQQQRLTLQEEGPSTPPPVLRVEKGSGNAR